MNLRLFKHKKAKKSKPEQSSLPPYSHCKNCGFELHGHYCSVCGQKAFVTNQAFKQSVMTYLDTNYAFDSKLGHTLRDIIIRPGYLAREFMNGRIARHVHPFKLYFFSSILLFGVMTPLSWSINKNSDIINDKPILDTTQAASKNSLEKARVSIAGDELKKDTTIKIGSGNLTIKADSVKAPSKRQEATIELDSAAIKEIKNYKPKSAFEKKLMENLTGVSKKELTQKAISYSSFAVLFLMPIFALLLMLIYRNKERYYIGHLILSVHLHVVLFLALSLSLVWGMILPDSVSPNFWIFLAMMVYLTISIAKFYEESIAKALLKGLLLLSMYSIITLIAVVAIGALVFLY